MTQTPKPHFRRLTVEPYERKPFLATDEPYVDVSAFSCIRYVVTFEYRTGWRRKWRKVKAYA